MKRILVILIILIGQLNFAQESRTLLIGKEDKVTEVVVITKQAEFPGGVQNLTKFFRENLKPRKRYAEKIIQVEILILKTGKVQDLKVKSEEAKISSKQVQSLLSKIPDWSSAISINNPIDSTIILQLKL